MPTSPGRSAGLTLAETLLVVAIIGVLMTVVLSLRPLVVRRARAAVAQNELRAIANALELYKGRFGTYPATGGLNTFRQDILLQYLRDAVRGVRDLDGEPMDSVLSPPEDRCVDGRFLDAFRLGRCYEYASNGAQYALRCAGPDGVWASGAPDEAAEQSGDDIVIWKR